MYKKKILMFGIIFLFLFSMVSFSQVTLNKDLIIKKVFSEKLIVKGQFILAGGVNYRYVFHSTLTVKLDKKVTGYKILNVYLNKKKHQKGVGNKFFLSNQPFNLKFSGSYMIRAELIKTGNLNAKPFKVDLAAISIKNYIKDLNPKYTSAVSSLVWLKGIKFNCIFKNGVFDPEVKVREIPPHGWIFTGVAPKGVGYIPANILKPETQYEVQIEKGGNQIAEIKYYKNASQSSYISSSMEYIFGFTTGTILIIKKVL